jgi:hypothetical protein
MLEAKNEMVRYVLEKRAVEEIPLAQGQSLQLKGDSRAQLERERLRQELWEAYGGELSHFFMVRRVDG